MDKKIKALFFDIDGTLVSFRTHKIPQSTVDALEDAKRNGVAVYISTGRPIMLINNLGQIEHLIDGYITTNGARCFVGNHTVCLHPILRADVDEVVADADRNDYSVIVVGERHLVVYHPTDIVRKVFVEGLGVVNLIFQYTRLRNSTHIYAVYSCTNCRKTRSQLQNNTAPTGKIFFPNWEIIFSQLSTAYWRINIQKLSSHCFPDFVASS